MKTAESAPGRPSRFAKPGRSGIEKRPDLALAALAGVLALALYLRTLAPGLLGGDSGEFQFAAWLASLPHPTGYPLYMLLGYAWTHLWPFGDPAYRMNLLSALAAALAVGLFFFLVLAALRLAGPGARPAESASASHRALAFGAALLFAATPTFWSQAVVAEVYALHAVLVIGILLALLTWAGQEHDAPPGLAQPRQGERPLYLAAALFGLGLAHHRSTVLLAPALVLFLLYHRACDRRRVSVRSLARALLLLLLPLLLYLYIPLRAPHTPYQRIALSSGTVLQLYQPTLAGFWQYVTGQVFEEAFRTMPAALAQVGLAVRLFVHELGWPVIVLGLAGLATCARRRGRPLLLLTGAAFLIIVVFNLFYGIGDIYVYYIPAYAIWVLWAAIGLAAIAGLAAGRVNKRSRSDGFNRRTERNALSAAALLAVLLAGWSVVARYASVDRSGNRQAGPAWEKLLATPIPAGSILISNDRDEIMPMWYEQYVNGARPDLAGLFPLIVPGPEWSDVGRVIGQGLTTGRPVFLIKPMPGLEVKFDLEPEGMLVRVSGPAAQHEPEKSAGLVFSDALRLAGYDLAPKGVRATEAVTVTLYWQPLRPLSEDYTSFVHLVNAEGAVIGQDDHRPGGVYYPSRLWQAGEVLKDVHVFRVSAPNPGSPPYTLVAGLYVLRPDLVHLGEPRQLGQIDLKLP